MEHAGAQMEVTLTVEYLENYDEAWFEMSDLIEEYGSGSEEVLEAEERLIRGIDKATPSAAIDAATRKVETVFEETETTFEVAASTVNRDGVEYTVILTLIFPDIQPSYSPNEQITDEIERKFDSHQMLS